MSAAGPPPPASPPSRIFPRRHAPSPSPSLSASSASASVSASVSGVVPDAPPALHAALSFPPAMVAAAGPPSAAAAPPLLSPSSLASASAAFPSSAPPPASSTTTSSSSSSSTLAASLAGLSPDDYAATFRIAAILDDLRAELLAHRPADPLAFIERHARSMRARFPPPLIIAPPLSPPAPALTSPPALNQPHSQQRLRPVARGPAHDQAGAFVSQQTCPVMCLTCQLVPAANTLVRSGSNVSTVSLSDTHAHAADAVWPQSTSSSQRRTGTGATISVSRPTSGAQSTLTSPTASPPMLRHPPHLAASVPPARISPSTVTLSNHVGGSPHARSQGMQFSAPPPVLPSPAFRTNSLEREAVPNSNSAADWSQQQQQQVMLHVPSTASGRRVSLATGSFLDESAGGSSTDSPATQGQQSAHALSSSPNQSQALTQFAPAPGPGGLSTRQAPAATSQRRRMSRAGGFSSSNLSEILSSVMHQQTTLGASVASVGASSVASSTSLSAESTQGMYLHVDAAGPAPPSPLLPSTSNILVDGVPLSEAAAAAVAASNQTAGRRRSRAFSVHLQRAPIFLGPTSPTGRSESPQPVSPIASPGSARPVLSPMLLQAAGIAVANGAQLMDSQATLTAPRATSPAASGVSSTAWEDMPASVEAALSSFPLFSDTPVDFRAELASKLVIRHHRAHELIVHRGDAARGMFFVLRGRVQVVSDDEETVLAEIGDHNYFGEMGLLFDKPRSASVVTATKCILLVMSKAVFDWALSECPEIADLLHSTAEARRAATALAAAAGSAPKPSPAMAHPGGRGAAIGAGSRVHMIAGGHAERAADGELRRPVAVGKTGAKNGARVPTTATGVNRQPSSLSSVGEFQGSVVFETLQHIVVFNECHPRFLHMLSELAESLLVQAGEVIIAQREVFTGLYFIVRGSVDVCSVSARGSTVLTQLAAGAFFGEAFSTARVCEYLLVAHSACDLLRVPADGLRKVRDRGWRFTDNVWCVCVCTDWRMQLMDAHPELCSNLVARLSASQWNAPSPSTLSSSMTS
jgi:CRP-like cAMP-binding protein